VKFLHTMLSCPFPVLCVYVECCRTCVKARRMFRKGNPIVSIAWLKLSGNSFKVSVKWKLHSERHPSKLCSNLIIVFINSLLAQSKRALTYGLPGGAYPMLLVYY
jgi:hypothetical protein